MAALCSMKTIAQQFGKVLEVCAEHAMLQLNVRGDIFFSGVLELGHIRKSFEESDAHSWWYFLANIHSKIKLKDEENVVT